MNCFIIQAMITFGKRMDVLESILKSLNAGNKLFAVLIDPQDVILQQLPDRVRRLSEANVDLILIGGSHTHHSKMDSVVLTIKTHSDIPCVVFPGHAKQLSSSADATLLLSLISGRNPEYLIGKHVESAMDIYNMQVEVIPTGYILVESGNMTAVHYVTNTLPIPRHKSDIAVSTAVAGQLLGMKMIYLEAGSGAQLSVPGDMIKAVKSYCHVPLIVGGGIRTPKQARQAIEAGADIVVVGTALEDKLDALFDFSNTYSCTFQI